VAKWFGFQPSELDAMELGDFQQWIAEGLRQHKAREQVNQG
jgi:hypothetical protein